MRVCVCGGGGGGEWGSKCVLGFLKSLSLNKTETPIFESVARS